MLEMHSADWIGEMRRYASQAARSAARALASWGVSLPTTYVAAKSFRGVRRDRSEFARQRAASSKGADFPFGASYTAYGDRLANAGDASGHYFHQDLIVAQEIFRMNPRRHIDVGSSVYGFVSHVASFRTIEVIDLRPLPASVPGITFIQRDAMNLGPEFDNAADSVSCLHALEHFGLGRYGDTVAYDGWRRGLEALTRIVQPGGRLYLSLPTSHRQRVEFNAHRVFSLPYIMDAVKMSFDIERVDFVTDEGALLADVDLRSNDALHSFNAEYGCSIWTLVRHTPE